MPVTTHLSKIRVILNEVSIIYNYGGSLIMKTEKPRKTLKNQAQPHTAKTQSAKAGIKVRSGLRAGSLMGFTDMY